MWCSYKVGWSATARTPSRRENRFEEADRPTQPTPDCSFTRGCSKNLNYSYRFSKVFFPYIIYYYYSILYSLSSSPTDVLPNFSWPYMTKNLKIFENSLNPLQLYNSACWNNVSILSRRYNELLGVPWNYNYRARMLYKYIFDNLAAVFFFLLHTYINWLVLRCFGNVYFLI